MEDKDILHRFIPASNFYWYYDKKYYFLKGVLYDVPEDLYNQIKHYTLEQNEYNNC